MIDKNLGVGKTFKVNENVYRVEKFEGQSCKCDLGKDHNCKQVDRPYCPGCMREDKTDVRFVRVDK